MHLENTCRACLCHINFPIYKLNDDISEKYRLCTSVIVINKPPNSICESCYQNVHCFYQFREKCIASHNYLVGLLTLESKSNDTTNESENKKNLPSDFVKLEDYFEDRDYEDNISETNVRLSKEKQSSTKETCINQIIRKSKIRSRLRQRNAGKERSSQNISTVCETCNKTFKTVYNLNKHIAVYHTTISFESMTCPKCGRVFSSSTIMQRHLKNKHDDVKIAPVVCHMCGNKFKNKHSLKNHLETHSNPNERTHACNTCGRSYMTAVHLSVHVSRAHSGRRYVCDFCKREFAMRNTMIQHMRSHMGIKRYACSLCTKTYVQSTFLKEHARVHTGERPFSCDVCSKCFISRRGLIEHKRIHTADKRYQCNLCSMAFIQRGSYNRHQKIHNKESQLRYNMKD